VTARISLRLFVSGRSPAAQRALENLRAVCDDEAVRRKYQIDLDVVDIQQSPELAEEDHILATPTLLKKLPLPVRRMVGDLSNQQDIYVTLDIESPHRSNSAEAEGG